jgi:hypothetical protein
MMRMIAISLFFLGGHAALAASSVIVDDKDVADAIARNVLVWDVRPADAYARGHIPGDSGCLRPSSPTFTNMRCAESGCRC